MSGDTNSNMGLDAEGWNNFINHTTEIWINPEIERRKKEGKISDKFMLHKVQVVIPPGKVPFVNLNEEVQAEISFELKDPTSKQPGEPIYPKELGERPIIILKDLDPNYGHVTIIPYKSGKLIKVDFRTNKQVNSDRQRKAEDHLTKAVDFFNSNEEYFINVKEAIRLSVISQMCTHFGEERVLDKPLDDVIHNYFEFIDLGNYKPEFKDLINKLFILGVQNGSKEEKEKILQTTKDLLEYTKMVSC